MLARDSDEIELASDPRFEFGQEVCSCKHVRNDGTYPGKEIGDLLVRKGDVGYVKTIGTFLQQFYIYGVDFYEQGVIVGMKARELEAVPSNEPEETS